MKHTAYFGRRLAAALLAAAVALTFAACGSRAGSQVAGADQQVIYGYVLEVNDQARTITVDPVELISGSDTQRLSQLGVNAAMGEGGSYAYNARRNFVMYSLDPAADFDFNDRSGGGNASSGSNSVGNGGSGSNGNSGSNSVGNGGSGSNGNSGSNSVGNGGSGSNGGSAEGGLMGGNGSGNGGAAANRANSAADNTNASQEGNSVSGSTTVGNGTASDSSVNGNDNNGSSNGNGGSGYATGGYGYTGVRGGLFSAFSNGYDRLNAYIEQYGDLLCRLVLENGAVTSVTVCTGDNM